MPKATVPALPLSGIFAVNKPSGPTSMSLLTRLKPLFSSSRLFVPEAELGTPRKGSKYPGPTPTNGKKQKKKPNWKKISKQYVKLGSGGTLDPLADGVLGSSFFRYHYFTMEPILTYHGSHWSWVRDEGSGAIHRVHKGPLELLLFSTGS
jgi:hypothetical protein